LTPGELRRLTLAEELVHSPGVILLDEPVTDLTPKDAAIIMNGALAHLVKQNCTVICTMHQPSINIFSRFDTLVLLSKGRLVYMGDASSAVSFFLESPSLSFDSKEYSNPADLLFNISGCHICNKNVSCQVFVLSVIP
jgi:ABC-type multidrug transport system ATPase subunit